MAFKQKVTVLGGLAAALAVIYIMTFVFAPERSADRSAAYRWVAESAGEGATEIVVGGDVKLAKKNGRWMVVEPWGEPPREFPARGSKVADLLTLLTTSAPYPIAATSEAAWESLGVEEASHKPPRPQGRHRRGAPRAYPREGGRRRPVGLPPKAGGHPGSGGGAEPLCPLHRPFPPGLV